MIKKLLLVAALLAVAGGLWWLIRRPSGAPQEDAVVASFSIQAAPPGWVVQHLDEQFPLRAFRWLPVKGDGTLVGQLVTQNDEQQVHLFRTGKFEGSWKIERPGSVPEGFFRFAELKGAFLLGDSTLLLFYGSGSNSAAEPSWLACLDRRHGQIRWNLRVEGGRALLTDEPKHPALFVWGSPRAVLRIPLQAESSKAPSPASIELPPEVQGPEDLVSMGRGFLISHGKGLSWFEATRGWVHHPLPVRPALLSFPGEGSHLARTASAVYWQPFPGLLFEVGSEPTAVQEIPLDLGPGQWLGRESRLLRLMGADAKGGLWFALARAVISPPAQAAVPAVGGEVQAGSDAAAPPAVSAEEMEAWQRQLGTGQGRIYRRPAAGGQLRGYDWDRLWKGWTEPVGFQVPQGDAGLRPETGLLVLGAERRIWWLPLSALGEGELPKPD